MAISDINIRVDSEIKAQAQNVFAMLGMDMSTAVNIFLQQSVRQNGMPFDPITPPQQPARKTPKLGCMKGKIWMADDFDAPLDDFKDYM
jgi:DNA-damage-inducible protein J